MTAKPLDYYINLADKAVVMFERTDSSFERISTVGKMLPNSTAGYRGIVHERKSQSMWPMSLLPHFKKLLQLLQPLTTSTLISQQPPARRQDPPPAK